jgi:hypothetical protein
MKGFRIETCFTYGSGFGAPGTVSRSLADRAAKRFGLGDMMVIAARGT